jgi:hypothetical protein
MRFRIECGNRRFDVVNDSYMSHGNRLVILNSIQDLMTKYSMLIKTDFSRFLIKTGMMVKCHQARATYYLSIITVPILVYLIKKRKIMNIGKHSISLLFMALTLVACSNDDATEEQNTPKISYTNPIEITVNDYNDHMMEPFISPDGNTLFFNNLNSNGNTRLFYATKVTTTIFDFKGEVNGANENNTSQLNAVADMDAQQNFYWTSIRDFPAQLDNLHYGTYSNGTVTNIGRVQGDFYVGETDWLVMDHGISVDGQTLFYNNGHFNGCGSIPCETFIGMAQKTSTGNFEKIANSDTILANINDPSYIYYAPSITEDNLEFYYTRFSTGAVDANTLVEMCVAIRNNTSDAFGIPTVLFAATVGDGIIEAATLTTDKQLMYYHKKTNGLHKIFMRERA